MTLFSIGLIKLRLYYYFFILTFSPYLLLPTLPLHDLLWIIISKAYHVNML